MRDTPGAYTFCTYKYLNNIRREDHNRGGLETLADTRRSAVYHNRPRYVPSCLRLRCCRFVDQNGFGYVLLLAYLKSCHVLVTSCMRFSK